MRPVMTTQSHACLDRMRTPFSLVFLACSSLVLLRAPQAEARQAVYINSTSLSMGNVSSVFPAVDFNRLQQLTLRERAPLGLIFPFAELAMRQSIVFPPIPSEGPVPLCVPTDVINAPCLRPGWSYMQFPPNASDSSEKIEVPQPPFAPQGLVVTLLNATTLHASWDSNPEVGEYEVRFMSDGRQGSADEVFLENAMSVTLQSIALGKNTSVTARGLPPFSWIQVVVVAIHATTGAYGYTINTTKTGPMGIEYIVPNISVAVQGQRIPRNIAIIASNRKDAPDNIFTAEAEVTNVDTGAQRRQNMTLVYVTLFVFGQLETNFGARIIGLQDYTLYRIRWRFYGQLTNTFSQYSNPVEARTEPDVQPSLSFLLSPVQQDPVSTLNVTWVRQTPSGPNITYFFNVLDRNLVPVQNFSCRDPCSYLLLDGMAARREEIRFLSGYTTNAAGTSARSDIFLLLPPPLPPKGDGGTSAATIVVATVVPSMVLILIAALLLWRRWKGRDEYRGFVFPPPDDWELDREDMMVNFCNELGHGAFGVVYSARTRRPMGTLATGSTLAVKMLRGDAPDVSKAALVEEATRMKHLGRRCHRNVLQLYGVCMQTEPLMIVMELAPHGTLRRYVQDNKSKLTLRDLARFCKEIADGMSWLSELRFVHRDLAARNCLMGRNYEVKVSDFGLARDVNYVNYYRKEGSALLPIRWMAPECLMEGKFTLDSDVWSFGVVVWEVYSFGLLPYSDFTNDIVYTSVIRGYRLPPPPGMPFEVSRLMALCFSKTRPLFVDLMHEFSSLEEKGGQDQQDQGGFQQLMGVSAV